MHIISYTTINTPYDWPAFLAASCYLSLHELIRICNYSCKGHIYSNAYNIVLNLKQLYSLVILAS